MSLTRREMLIASAGALASMSTLVNRAAALADVPKKRLGIASHSYNLHDRAQGEGRAFTRPDEFLDFCHQLGAGGIQTSLPARDAAANGRLKEKAASYGMFVEGSLSLPKSEADVERFDAQVRSAKECGAEVVRTVMLSGRRYETFADAESFRDFAKRSYQSLALAEPVVARHRMRLAVENHKDWRIDEMTAMMKAISSEFVGVCIDTGNSIALLEDPLEVVEAYAGLANSVHLKDMAVAPYADGFLLAEVNLGQGILDLRKIVDTVRQARPQVQIVLEMITRDPLRVPCLTDKYWATFDNVPAKQLARTLAMVRDKAAKEPLPKIEHLDKAAQLAAEDDNVRRCVAYARERLDI